MRLWHDLTARSFGFRTSAKKTESAAAFLTVLLVVFIGGVHCAIRSLFHHELAKEAGLFLLLKRLPSLLNLIFILLLNLTAIFDERLETLHDVAGQLFLLLQLSVLLRFLRLLLLQLNEVFLFHLFYSGASLMR